MSMEEIEKLRARVEKDPNSRFFLPLAEEYRKAGLLDEAIAVILKGLEHQPGYTSARVALGRLYLEKDMMNEARAEFENVVKTIPDNLFSHKKLAEIYKAEGETLKAAEECKKVLELNPLDEDAKLCLEEIGGKAEEAGELLPPSIGTEEAGVQEAPSEAKEDIGEEHIPEAAEETFEDFSASFQEKPEEMVFPVQEDMSIKHQEEDISIQPREDDVSIQPEEEEAEVFDLLEEADTEEATVAESVEAEPPAEQHESLAADVDAPSMTADDISTADSFIADGSYYKAMEIYKKILAVEPNNKHVLQKVIELKSLLKLLGKGEEMLVERLDAFLGAVKRNFDKSG
jgi:tetratricopeptide (TPR) repeat protein